MISIPKSFPTEWVINKSDEEIGYLFLGYVIASEANLHGFPGVSPTDIPDEFRVAVIGNARKLEAEYPEHEWVARVFNLLAAGEIKKAGGLLRCNLVLGAKALAFEGNTDNIRRGKRVIDGARQGHRAVHGSSAEKNQRWLEMAQAVKYVLLKNPHISQTEACRRVASTFGVNGRTVERAFQRSEQQAE